MSFRRVAAADALWPGEMLGLEVEGTKLLLVHLDDGVRAFENRCAHLGMPLDRGCLRGHTLVCRAHEWSYDARDGRGTNPRGVALRGFPTRVDEHAIYVDLDG